MSDNRKTLGSQGLAVPTYTGIIPNSTIHYRELRGKKARIKEIKR